MTSIHIATWDSSVVGITADEMADMEDDEQRERALDEINRAADLLQAVVSAFGRHMTAAQRATLAEAARATINVAREFDSTPTT